MTPLEIAKRAVYLAWQACGGPFGAGVLQDKPEATEDEVWNNVMTAGDYPFRGQQPEGLVTADYVFGRMMKLRFSFDSERVHIPEGQPRSDYQAWCRVYRTYGALFVAAKASLEQEGR